MQLKVATVAETVTVSGASPIVDTNATGTATNFTADELTKIPTSRDPFALMRAVPGVLVDRVNIGGNETGQQSNFASKGTRPQDAVWTLDGIDITDMAATGASPTLFQLRQLRGNPGVDRRPATSSQPTGGIGLNLVVKRGTNQFQRRRARLLRQRTDGVVQRSGRAEGRRVTARHLRSQQADLRLRRSSSAGRSSSNKAWFYGSYSLQDVRLVRRAGALVDRTQLKNPNVKLNWQATKKDMLSFLYFDGFKIKDGRSPAVSGILFDAPTATYHQDNAYDDFPLHGLWKIADDRVFGTEPVPVRPSTPTTTPASRSIRSAASISRPDAIWRPPQSYGSVNQGLNVRPQQTASVMRTLPHGIGGSATT